LKTKLKGSKKITQVLLIKLVIQIFSNKEQRFKKLQLFVIHEAHLVQEKYFSNTGKSYTNNLAHTGKVTCLIAGTLRRLQ
jgi:hypothetical protein